MPRCDYGYDEARDNGRYTNTWGEGGCMRAWVDEDGCVRMQYCPTLDYDGPEYNGSDYEEDEDGNDVEVARQWYPTHGAQACLEGTALAFVRSSDGKRALEAYARRAGWLNEQDAQVLRDEVKALRERINELTGEDDREGMKYLDAVTFGAMVQGAGGGWEVDRIASGYYDHERYNVYAYNRLDGRSATFTRPMNSAALAARLGLEHHEQ